MSSIELTEQDWLHSADPIRLLAYLFPVRGFHSMVDQPRKLRLYYAACARRRHAYLSPIQRGLVEAAEHLADGNPAGEVRRELYRLGEEHANGRDKGLDGLNKLAELLKRSSSGWNGKREVASPEERSHLRWLVFQAVHDVVPSPVCVHPWLHSADLVREVFPSTFRPTEWKREWRTTESMRIARGMYESRDFDGMRPLADALEEAGCCDKDVLLHCRDEENRHCRGCWVVDGLLDADAGYRGLQ